MLDWHLQVIQWLERYRSNRTVMFVTKSGVLVTRPRTVSRWRSEPDAE